MENNQNKTSQPQGSTSSSTIGSTASTPGSTASTSGSSNNSGSNSSSSNQKGSSLGGMNMGNLTQQLQKYSGPIMNKVNGLSTTQKVIGGTLLAAGAGWLAMNSKNKRNSMNNINRTPRKKY